MARLLALVVAAVLALSGCGGGGSSSAPGAAQPQVVAGSLHCPDPTAPPASDDGTDSLPSGAQAALLCVHDNRVPWVPPRGVLTTRLDSLVGVVNRQVAHRLAPDVRCGSVGAPAWSMVFRYAGGIRTISGDNGGCWDLLVGRSERLGSRNVYQAYLADVLRQRHDQNPSDVLWQAPGCPSRRSPADPALAYPVTSPAAQAGRVVTGTWCRRDGRHWVIAGPATRTQLAVLRHDITTAADRRHVPQLDGCRGLPTTAQHTLLVGRDAWGDPLGVEFSCDEYQLFTAPYPRARDVRMLPGTVAVVASVQGR